MKRRLVLLDVEDVVGASGVRNAVLSQSGYPGRRGRTHVNEPLENPGRFTMTRTAQLRQIQMPPFRGIPKPIPFRIPIQTEMLAEGI